MIRYTAIAFVAFIVLSQGLRWYIARTPIVAQRTVAPSAAGMVASTSVSPPPSVTATAVEAQVPTPDPTPLDAAEAAPPSADEACGAELWDDCATAVFAECRPDTCTRAQRDRLEQACLHGACKEAKIVAQRLDKSRQPWPAVRLFAAACKTGQDPASCELGARIYTRLGNTGRAKKLWAKACLHDVSACTQAMRAFKKLGMLDEAHDFARRACAPGRPGRTSCRDARKLSAEIEAIDRGTSDPPSAPSQ